MQDSTNQLMKEAIDRYGWEKMVAYTIQHKHTAPQASCQLIESKLRQYVKVDGFRDPNTAPNNILIKNVLIASARYKSLKNVILKVWVNLKMDMKMASEKIVDQNKPEMLSIYNHEDKSEEHLHKLIDNILEQLLENKDYILEEARLIVVYTVGKYLNKIHDEEGKNINHEDQPDNKAYQHEKVDLGKWYICLKIVPASSEIWDEVDNFIQLTSELATRKKQERTGFNRLNEAISRLKEECQEELAFFELSESGKWSPSLAASEQYENLAINIERLIQLFQHYTELRCGEMPKTISEEENRRRITKELEVEIKQLCIELSSRFDDSVENVTSEMLEESSAEIVNQPNNKITTDSGDVSEGTDDTLLAIQVESQNELNKVVRTKGIDVDSSCGDGGSQKIEALDELYAQSKIESEYKIEKDKPVKFDVLYKEIQEACYYSKDIPRAWVLLKTCQELYGSYLKLEELPTLPLMELYYLGQRLHYDPILFSTRHKTLDSLTSAIKTADVSPAQAVMHFAVSLPLVLAHAYDPLRASFFYVDYIPGCFEPMYSMLVEQSNMVNIPIIDLCGAEQKQQQNEEQRSKIVEQIEQAFYQYSSKNKTTSIDTFFFPRYGKGPLHWIRDGVKNQDSGPDFRDRLIRTNSEDVFALFTDSRNASVRNQKLANIATLRGGAIDKIQYILDLASAWVATYDQSQELDDFQNKSFRQLHLLFDEYYNNWIENLDKQTGEFKVACCWMKQSLEQLFQYMRGVEYAVGHSK